MTVAIAVVAVLAVALAMAVVELVILRRKADWVLSSRLRREVVVTLQSGPAFSGVLYEYDGSTCVLREAVGLNSDRPAPVDGELLLRWSDIAYCQLP